jgi:N-acetylglucosaminyl-diphospho-decaprenol L-rhamnosyltransferase
MDNRKTVAVIVNYNDADTTIALLSRIRDYRCLDRIILVDNASTDASYIRLKSLASERVTVLEAETNGGYGCGNNIGIRYADTQLGAAYALIANPDTEFSERCVWEMVRVMERHPDLGVIAPVKTTPDRNEEVCIPGTRANVLNGAAAWPVRPWLYDLLESGPVSRRIFTKLLHYGQDYYRDRTCVSVGAVPGSLLLVDIGKMLSCGAYDEQVFLYGEEYMLAWNMRARGYRTALLLSESYVHRHSVSIRKSIRALLARQKLREESTIHYYRKYLGIGPFRLLLTKIFYFFVNLEVILWERIGSDGRTP